jgi:imidazolonepropionase
MTLVAADLLLDHAAQLATPRDPGPATGPGGPECFARSGPLAGDAQGEVMVVEDGAVASAGGRIVAVGRTADVRSAVDCSRAHVVDCSGAVLLPGLVDAHTHPVFAGSRLDEFAARLAGATLAEVAARGGGIGRSVRLTRAASDAELERNALAALESMAAWGTTTVEAKSGYGLTTAEELRALRIIERLAARAPVGVVPTFLGAHVVPDEFRGTAEEYVAQLIGETIPAVAAQGIARSCDVCCEAGYFSVDQSERILEAAARYGLPARVHADAWAPSGGYRLAVEHGALSVDHCTHTPLEEIRAVGPTRTVAVLLPAAELVYLETTRAPARTFVECGVPVALATDYCSSIDWIPLQTAAGLGAFWFRLTPAQTLVAVTLNAAYAAGCAAECGSLEVGKRCDVLVLEGDSYELLVARLSRNAARHVVRGGRLLKGER